MIDDLLIFNQQSTIINQQSFLGEQEFVEAVGVMPQDSADDIIYNLKAAIEKLQNSDGVLILSGIFGESCCTFSLSLCRHHDIVSSCPLRVVTGVNLPMRTGFLRKPVA